MPIAFRRAAPADTDTIVGLMREYYQFDQITFEQEHAHEALAALLREPAFGIAWLIEDDGAAVGYMVLALGYSLEYHGRDAYIDELYLRERYRGRGVGGQALDLLEDACRELGVRVLHLEVERENEHAQAVYARRGYRDGGRFLLNKWLV